MVRPSIEARRKAAEDQLKESAARMDDIMQQISELRCQGYEVKRRIVSARGKIGRVLLSRTDHEGLRKLLQESGGDQPTPAWIKKRYNNCYGTGLWPSVRFDFEHSWYPGNSQVQKMIYRTPKDILSLFLMDEKIAKETKEVIKEAILAQEGGKKP